MEAKNLTILFGNREMHHSRDPREAKFFKMPYSEANILELQNIFLTKGFHHIKTPSLEQGRKLITLFLESLHCYYDPACFTSRGVGLKGAVNIYQEMQNKNKEIFFHDNPFIDFMWIEMPSKVEPRQVVEKFIQTCGSLQLERRMPIVVLHSEE